MAEKTIEVYASDSALVKESAPETNFSAGKTVTLNADDGRVLIFQFAAPAAAYQYCRFIDNRSYNNFAAYVAHNATSTRKVYVRTLKAPVDLGKITYSSLKTNALGTLSVYKTDDDEYHEFGLHDDELRDALRNGVALESYDTHNDIDVSGVGSNNEPYLNFAIDTADTVGLYIASASPSGGYINRTKETVFRWEALPDGECYGDVIQSGGILVWKVGESGTLHNIDVGTASSCTVPANTFPAATEDVRWQVQLQSNSGTETVSKWYSFTTADAVPVAAAVSPANTILDGAADNAFRWTHSTANGTQQTAYDLQYSTDGSTWTDLLSGSGAETSTTIPAGTLPAGAIYWRVRTYNQDAVASEWSSAAEIIVISAPSAPNVTVEDVSPRPVLQWSSLGQQGFEVAIGDYSSGTVFGASQRWQCPEVLPDGNYVARVRVINTYGLWSDWGSTPLTISHTAGAEIALQAEAAHAVDLFWSTSGAYDRYIVLRDGVPIAKTRELNYTDNRSIGGANYQVMGIPAAGWGYGLSNAVSCTVTVETLMLCDLTAGEWHTLRLSDQQHRTFAESITQTVTRVNLSGRVYPVAEKTHWRNRTVTVTWADTDPAALTEYDGLLGKTVCVKSPGGRMVYGLVDNIQRTESVFYTVYSAEIWQLDDTEVIDYDP